MKSTSSNLLCGHMTKQILFLHYYYFIKNESEK